MVKTPRRSDVERNFVDATIVANGELLCVLLNQIHPYVATCRTLNRPLEFVDHEPLRRALSNIGAYRVLTKDELHRLIDQSVVEQLADAELRQLEYWKPTSIGELIFNWWD